MNKLDKRLNDDYLQSVINGNFQAGRGTPTFSEFGELFRWSMRDGFPLSTQSKKNMDYIAKELHWFYRGDTSVRQLDAPIWDSWDRELHDVNRIFSILSTDSAFKLSEYLWSKFDTLDDIKLTSPISDYCIMTKDSPSTGFSIKVMPKETTATHELSLIDIHINTDYGLTTGRLGPVYGKMFRGWECPDGRTVDQLNEFLDGIKNNPFSRRHIIDLWNPAVLPDESKSHCENIHGGKAVLPPCHMVIQANVRVKNICDILIDAADKSSGVHLQEDDFENLIIYLRGNLIKKEIEDDEDLDALIWMFEQASKDKSNDPDVLIKNLINALFRANFLANSAKRELISQYKGVKMLTFNKLRSHSSFKSVEIDYDQKIVDLLFYMRSNDRPVGRPYNIASYGLMLLQIAHITGYEAGDLVQGTGNGHVYVDQLASVRRVMEMSAGDLPTITLKDRGQENLWDFKLSDIEIQNYNPGKFVKHNVNE